MLFSYIWFPIISTTKAYNESLFLVIFDFILKKKNLELHNPKLLKESISPEKKGYLFFSPVSSMSTSFHLIC